MIFWKNIANFVNMKSDITFLPGHKQRDLHELVGLITEEVKDVVMIILFGSYATGKYVEYDERHDFGENTIFLSDFDLLVVTEKRLGVRESVVQTRVNNRFSRGKSREYYTRPRIINESISKLNDSLSNGRYFYVEIISKGIMLYNTGKYSLEAPRKLNYSEIKNMALEYFNAKFPKGRRFVRYANVALNDQQFVDCTFLLHQATENLVKCIPMVYTLYKPKDHDLETLIDSCRTHTMEIVKVFPRKTYEEKRIFSLLQSAYIEARYNEKFKISIEDINVILARIDVLEKVVEKVCRDRIAYYESQIEA